MILFETNKTAVYCVGDIHGNFATLGNFIKRFLSDCAVICCGDIGMGFNKPAYYDDTFKRLSDTASKCNVEIYMLRGNHDDPSYFSGDGKEYGSVHLVPDYSVLKAADGTCALMVGGATSIDRLTRIAYDEAKKRAYRLRGSSKEVLSTYWENEAPIFNEKALLDIERSGLKINTVCTHTCPSFCDPVTFGIVERLFESDTHLKEDIQNERSVMDSLYAWLNEHSMKPSTWTYGHYHRSNREVIDGTMYVMLDMCDDNHSSFDVFELNNGKK